MLGFAVIVYGFARFLAGGSIASLLVSSAVLIAGPLEDLLKWLVRRTKKVAEEPAIRLVDLATSVAFLILLLIVIYLLP